MSQIAERPVEAPAVSSHDRERHEPEPPAPSATPSLLVRGRAWCERHPDLAPLAVILTLGLVFRLALLYRVPPLFMPGDSQSFLIPAYDLARGLGFDPILKRPLGYPLLLAGSIVLLGEDLRALVFVQAMLGLVTVAATYWIGRLIFGRLAGSLAALSVAIGGQLLIYEHYVLAESVFAMFLALAVLGLVAAVRVQGSAYRVAAAGGVALAFASLFRPIAEALVPLIPIYYLVTVLPRRRALTLTAVALVAFAATMVPAAFADLFLRGGFSSGALGEHLLWRLTRSDSGYLVRADIPPDQPGSPEATARRYVIRKAVERTLPQEIFTGLVRDLGMAPGDADALMRAIAIEAMLRQPARYVASTLRMTVELFFADDQSLGEVSKRDGEAGYINPQARQRTWFEERIFHLGEPPSAAVENEFESATWLTTLYQPGRFLWILGAGFLVGCVVCLVSRPHRIGLLLVLAIPPMLLANAAIAGPEARFRYPVDPLIAVVAFGGLVWLTRVAWTGTRGRRAASVSTNEKLR